MVDSKEVVSDRDLELILVGLLASLMDAEVELHVAHAWGIIDGLRKEGVIVIEAPETGDRNVSAGQLGGAEATEVFVATATETGEAIGVRLTIEDAWWRLVGDLQESLEDEEEEEVAKLEWTFEVNELCPQQTRINVTRIGRPTYSLASYVITRITID